MRTLSDQAKIGSGGRWCLGKKSSTCRRVLKTHRVEFVQPKGKHKVEAPKNICGQIHGMEIDSVAGKACLNHTVCLQIISGTLRQNCTMQMQVGALSKGLFGLNLDREIEWSIHGQATSVPIRVIKADPKTSASYRHLTSSKTPTPLVWKSSMEIWVLCPKIFQDASNEWRMRNGIGDTYSDARGLTLDVSRRRSNLQYD